MNQGLQYSVAAIVPAMRQSGLMRSRCTITVPPDQVLTPDETFGASGAALARVAYPPLAGHVDIPCSAPTGFSVAPGDEAKSAADVIARNVMPVSLLGYFPAITQDYRAVIDDVEYDILSVGADSQIQATRMVVQKATI